MIQQHMGFDITLGATELGPREQRQAKGDGGRIQAEQLVAESELVMATAKGLLVSEACQHRPKQVFEQCGWAMFFGIRQGGTARRLGNAQMHQPPQTASQAVKISRRESARPS